MNKNYKKMSNEKFLKGIDKLCENLQEFLENKKIRIDYICPILRSGAIPAVYISNRLNIVKFLPFQAKHITYKNGENNIEVIFNPLNHLEIKKESPVFLVVDALFSTGTSAEICIKEIYRKYPNAQVLYVCLVKKYDSKSFSDIAIYEDHAFSYTENKELNEKELDMEYNHPLFPWEILDFELNHPDDLEGNIYF